MDIVVPLTIVLLLGTLVLMLSVRLVPQEERTWLLRVLIGAFLLRVAVATMFGIFPETRIFHEDAQGYEVIGLRIARGWLGLGPPSDFFAVMGYNQGYYAVSAAACVIFGLDLVSPSYLNALIGPLTVLFCYRLARKFFHVRVARQSALLSAFIPSMILWSSMALKDPVVTFCIVVALDQCIELKRRFSLKSLFGTLLPVAAVQPMRFYMVYFLTFAVLGSLIFERGFKAVSGVYKQIVVAGVMVALLVLVGLGGGAMQGTEMLDLAKVSSFRNGMATTANSGFAADVDVSTPAGALLFLPYGASILLLGPFPWQFTSTRALFAAPETILWWILFPSFLRGVAFALRHRFGPVSPLILFSGTLTAAYSLVHGNVGSGFRQRAQLFVLFFIFTALGRLKRRVENAGLDPRRLLSTIDQPPRRGAAPAVRMHAQPVRT